MNKKVILSAHLVGDIMKDTFKSIPQLLGELAPEGYRNSKYIQLFHDSPEKQYKHYQDNWLYRRRFSSKRNRWTFFRVFPKLKTFEQFKRSMKPPPANENLEMQILLLYCFIDVSSRGYYITIKNQEQCVLFGFDELFIDIWERLLKACEIDLDKDKFRAIYLRISNYLYKSINNQDSILPAFQIFFKSLNSKGIEWHYRNDTIELLSSLLTDHEVPMVEYDPEKAVLNSIENQGVTDEEEEDDYDSCKGESMLSIEEINKIIDDRIRVEQQEVPNDYIIAYFDVYGHFPDGYPSERKYYF